MAILPKPVVAIATITVLAALLPMPYGYYEILRVFICGVFLYGVISSKDKAPAWILWVMGAFAVIYNPIASLHLGRELWSVVNVITAGFLIAIQFIKEKQ